MLMRVATSTFAVALLATVAVAAESTQMFLVDALDELRAQGYRIAFSTELVHASTRIPIGSVTLESVRGALPPLGLELVRSGELWLIVAAARPPVADAAPGAAPARQQEPETVIVTGTRHRLSATRQESGITLPGEELRAIPALASDSMRSANRLPGLASVGVSARPRMRGGLEDETLVLLDGVELLDAYHGADFQSLLSAIDDRLVDTVDVYTGGFPTRFGNRMSGAVDVRTLHDGESSTAVGVSTITTVANARRSSADGAFVASARRGNLDTIADRVNSQLGEPRYVDAYVRGDWSPSPGLRVETGALGIGDDILVKDERDSAQSNVETGYLWTRLDATPSREISGRTIVGAVVSLRNRKAELVDADRTLESYLDLRETYREANVRTDWSLGRDTDSRFEVGAELHVGDVSYDSRAFADREELLPLTGELAPDDHDLHVRADGTWGGAYASLDVDYGRFTVQPGLRTDVQHYGGGGYEAQVSPRLGVRYAIAETTQVRLDVGRFQQPESLHELPVSDGADDFTKAQRADQLSVAFDHVAARDAFRVEAYSKRYDDVKRRFENLFDPFVLAPEIEPDRVLLVPDGVHVRGFDAEVRHAFTNELGATLRYGYLDANERIAHSWVPRRWSQRHTLNGILLWQTERTVVSGAIAWHSGWRSATPPDELPVGETVPIDQLLNNTELESYLSIDVGIRHSWRIGRSEITLFADLTNITNRDNVAGIDYDVETVGSNLEFSPDRSTLLPIVPSIGVLIEL